MVFKVIDNNLTTIFNKVQDVTTGVNLSTNSINRYVEDFNNINSKQAFGHGWEQFLNGMNSQNANMATYFEDLAKQGASAKANIEGVYAAILDGNTRGIGNVKSIISMYNAIGNVSPVNQKAFATAVGQTNTQLGNYLTNLQGSNASLKGYTFQLVATTAKTLALKAASIALNMALTTGISWLINKGIQAWQDFYQSQEELRESARETAKTINDQTNEMKQLVSQYEAILDSEKTEAEKTEELNEWKQNLAETYSIEKDRLADVNLEREKGIQLLKDEIALKNYDERSKWLGKNQNQFEIAKGKITDTNYSKGTDGKILYSILNPVNTNEIRDSVKNLFDNIFNLSGTDGAYTFEVAGDNLIEKYENIQKIITKLGSSKNLTKSEQKLLDDLNKESENIKKVLDDYQDIYETGYKYLAENNFADYIKNNPLEEVGKENYLSWRSGLLETAQGDEQLRSDLQDIITNQFPDLEKYYQNLAKARSMFAVKVNSVSDAQIATERDKFLSKLEPEELEVAIQIPDLFENGLDDALKKIRDKMKNNPIELKVAFDNEEFDKKYEEATKAVTAFTSSQKDLNSALEEQKEHGQLSASTMQSLIDNGYAEALTIDKVTGAVTLNTEKYRELNNEKKKEIQLEIARLRIDLINPYKEESLAIADLERSLSSLNETEREATLVKIANMRANLTNSNLTDEQVKQKEQQLADLEAMLASLDAPTFDNKDNTDPNKDAFDKLYSKWQHDLEMNRVTQEEYINWLDGAYKQYFSDLTKYEEEYNKYEEEVYKARLDREQDLFDKKIENYKKLSDNALNKYVDGNGAELTVNASFDYAREQINSAITETQNRINELSLKTGFEDEIEELKSDLEDLYDTLEDINKKEIESQKEYIETLKNEYSDLMDEQIDQQKKLADSINEAYEIQIDLIDKQIDAINKVSEAEERQKKILDAEKDVKEAMQELDKASIKNRLVYSGDGTWQLKEDKTAVQEAKDNLAEKQEALDEAKQDEQISKLEEQKELLEEQKNNNKDYYDKVVADLEEQKSEREKQYDILVDIYEQLGGEKRQTSLNDSLVTKLTSNGDINKAVQGLTPTEMKQAITSGILTTDSDGNYAIDYSILDKNEQAVRDNTEEIEKAKSELEKLNNQFSGENQSNTPVNTNKNLDAEGYLIGTDGKRILNDGKTIHAKNFSSEIEKRKNNEKIGKAVSGIGKFAGYDTMKGLLNAIMTGEYTVPTSTANSMMNSNINSSIGRDITKVPEYVNNVVTNNNAPVINQTFNIDGSADDKTVQAFKTVMDDKLIEYTQYMTQSMDTAFMRQINKS